MLRSNFYALQGPNPLSHLLRRNKTPPPLSSFLHLRVLRFFIHAPKKGEEKTNEIRQKHNKHGNSPLRVVSDFCSTSQTQLNLCIRCCKEEETRHYLNSWQHVLQKGAQSMQQVISSKRIRARRSLGLGQQQQRRPDYANANGSIQ